MIYVERKTHRHWALATIPEKCTTLNAGNLLGSETCKT